MSEARIMKIKVGEMANGRYGMLIDDVLLYGRVIYKRNDKAFLVNPDRVDDEFTDMLKQVQLLPSFDKELKQELAKTVVDYGRVNKLEKIIEAMKEL
jgi:hypothetical protein